MKKLLHITEGKYVDVATTFYNRVTVQELYTWIIENCTTSFGFLFIKYEEERTEKPVQFFASEFELINIDKEEK